MAWSLNKTPSGPVNTPPPAAGIPKEPAWRSTVPKSATEKVPKVPGVAAGESKLDLKKSAGIKNPLMAKNEQAAVTRPRGLRYGGLLSK